MEGAAARATMSAMADEIATAAELDAAEAMIETGMHTWDVAAPLVLIEEAGGRVTDVTGVRRIDGPSFVASNGHLHDELLRRLAGAG